MYRVGVKVMTEYWVMEFNADSVEFALIMLADYMHDMGVDYEVININKVVVHDICYMDYNLN